LADGWAASKVSLSTSKPGSAATATRDNGVSRSASEPSIASYSGTFWNHMSGTGSNTKDVVGETVRLWPISERHRSTRSAGRAP
jgi:hypothetical protein